MNSPHSPQTASLLLGLAQDYSDACNTGNEFAASEGARAALQSRHMHGHLKLVLMDERGTRRPKNRSDLVLVGIPLALWKTVIQPLLKMVENDEIPTFEPLPSFAERVWPRVTVN